MKFTDIQAGKKYWRKQTEDSNKRSGSAPVMYLAVRVLQKDEAKREVLASIGQAPAKWYTNLLYARWIATNPELKTDITQNVLKR